MLSTVTTHLSSFELNPEHQRAQEVACIPKIHLPPDPPCLAQKLLQKVKFFINFLF